MKIHKTIEICDKCHKEMKEGRPKLSKLMKILDIVPLYYYTQNTNYYFTEA